MIDFTLNQQGKIQKITTDEEKIRNLIYIKKGALHYQPALGFDLFRYFDASYQVNWMVILTQLHEYLLGQGVSIAEMTSLVKDLVLEFQIRTTHKTSTTEESYAIQQ